MNTLRLYSQIPIVFSEILMKFISIQLIALSLLACQSPRGEDTPGIWRVCDSTETSLSMSESSGLGLSAEDVIAQVAGSHASTAVYGEDLSSTVALTVALSSTASEAIFVDQSVNGQMNGQMNDTADEDVCPVFLKTDVDIVISTDDGAFSEDIPLILRAYADGRIEVVGVLDLDLLQGSYAPDTAGASSAHLELSMAWDADSVFSGSLKLVLESESGDTAWASIDTIISWPLSAQE
jgi:hypothetical protein